MQRIQEEIEKIKGGKNNWQNFVNHLFVHDINIQSSKHYSTIPKRKGSILLYHVFVEDSFA